MRQKDWPETRRQDMRQEKVDELRMMVDSTIKVFKFVWNVIYNPRNTLVLKDENRQIFSKML